jgi:hypothetical protein
MKRAFHGCPILQVGATEEEEEVSLIMKIRTVQLQTTGEAKVILGFN